MARWDDEEAAVESKRPTLAQRVERLEAALAELREHGEKAADGASSHDIRINRIEKEVGLT